MLRLSTSKVVWSLGKNALLPLALLCSLAACTLPQDAASKPPAIRVVTTTNIVADWVENIGGDHVEVLSLVPVGSDPHAFRPGAQDITKIADADLVLSVGLGLEESWLKELLQNAARDPSTIVELGDIIDPIEFAESHADEVEILEELSHVVHEVEEGEIDPKTGLEEIKELLVAADGNKDDEDHGEKESDGDEEDHGDEENDGDDEDHGDEEELPAMVLAIVNDVEEGRMEASDAIEAIETLTASGEDEHADHGHGLNDPHFWFDPLRVKLAVNDISVRMSALDPERGDAYGANAVAYNARLDELHAWTEEQTSTVPENRRLLVTSHDSLGYFANLYGFEVAGVILSTTTEAEASAEDIAELSEEVAKYGIPAVFGETTVSERVAQSLASETGAKLVRLYSGSLGIEGSGAETYIDMLRTNVGRIVEALK